MTDLTLTEREKALIALAATSAAKVATEELAANNEQLAIALERAEEAEAEAEAVRATATEAMSTLGDLACAWALECGQTLGVSCVYCGAEWGQHEYATLDRAHAFDCPKHPMREVERERDGALEHLRCETEAHAATLADLTAAESDLQAATARAEKAERAWRMYREAWIRELGGVLIPKAGGEIDSLVATTQALRADLQVAARRAAKAEARLDQWHESTESADAEAVGKVLRFQARYVEELENDLAAATEREGRMREALVQASSLLRNGSTRSDALSDLERALAPSPLEGRMAGESWAKYAERLDRSLSAAPEPAKVEPTRERLLAVLRCPHGCGRPIDDGFHDVRCGLYVQRVASPEFREPPRAVDRPEPVAKGEHLDPDDDRCVNCRKADQRWCHHSEETHPTPAPEASKPAAKVEPPGELIPVSAVLRLLREQPFAPGTHTGTRQRWVLDEVARKVEAWPEAVEPANAFARKEHPLVGTSHGGTTVTSHWVAPAAYRHLRPDVLAAIDSERARQEAKFPNQRCPNGTGADYLLLRDIKQRECDEAFRAGYGSWAHILVEEVFEACAEDEPASLRKELLEVAAVCFRWVDALEGAAQMAAPVHLPHCATQHGHEHCDCLVGREGQG